MVDQQIISNLHLELAETIVGVYDPLTSKVNETNMIYSRRGYFQVSNEGTKASVIS